MKKRQAAAPQPVTSGTALVNLAENRPSGERGAKSKGELVKISETFRSEALAQRAGFLKGLQWSSGAGNLVVTALGSATMLTPIFALVLGTIAAMTDHMSRRNMQMAVRRMYRERQLSYTLSQQKSYMAKERSLSKLADQVLTEGELIDEKALSYLALLPPKILYDASDQLAITVLQARAVLFRRSKAMSPLTFARLDLDPGCDDHRAVLRAELMQNDIVEFPDRIVPRYEPLEEEIPVMFDTSVQATFKRIAILPYHMWKDKRTLRKYEPPPLPEPVIPPLQSAPQLAQKLADFESREYKLDLPALRGWPAPAPRRMPGASPLTGVRQLPRP